MEEQLQKEIQSYTEQRKAAYQRQAQLEKALHDVRALIIAQSGAIEALTDLLNRTKAGSNSFEEGVKNV